MNTLSYLGQKIKLSNYFFIGKIIVLVNILFLVLIFLLNNHYNSSIVFVSNVIDGNTFCDQKNHYYHFFGIGFQSTTNQFLVKNINPKKYLSKQITNKYVNLIYIKKDKNNYQIVKVYYQKIDIGLKMVKDGYALINNISLNPTNPFYTNDFNYFSLLVKMQYYAFKHKLGFWKV